MKIVIAKNLILSVIFLVARLLMPWLEPLFGLKLTYLSIFVWLFSLFVIADLSSLEERISKLEKPTEESVKEEQ